MTKADLKRRVYELESAILSSLLTSMCSNISSDEKLERILCILDKFSQRTVSRKEAL